jgi:hypothetical protein
MITKIISGGQTGVDRAALDLAIQLGLAHGGWVPKGRLAEDGPLPATYRLRETDTAVYAERTERNVVDSDGTLIISRGALSGGTEYTRQMALKHDRPLLHIDLKRTAAFRAAMQINEWAARHGIRVLNVAGPRASKDPRIYQDTRNLLESAYHLGLSAGDPRAEAAAALAAAGEADPAPQRVRDAVERLTADLPLKDKVTIANMAESEVPALLRKLGEHIITRFELAAGNTALLRSCRWVARRPLKDERDAAAVIVRALWKQLQHSHTLRRVK